MTIAKHDALTEDQWKKVRESFADVGVDADTVMVETRNRQVPLREMLPRMAEGCDIVVRHMKDTPTPSQLATEQEQTIKLCKDLLARLSGQFTHVDYGILQNGRGSRRRQRICENLEPFIKELEDCRDRLTAMGGNQGKSNNTAHNLFWKKLMLVWYAETGKGIARGQKYPANFLLACSEPYFPKETSPKAVDTFVQRHISRK
jgi:hypothetical protein